MTHPFTVRREFGMRWFGRACEYAVYARGAPDPVGVFATMADASDYRDHKNRTATVETPVRRRRRVARVSGR